MLNLTHHYQDDLKVFLQARMASEHLQKRLLDAREAHLWLRESEPLPKYEKVKKVPKGGIIYGLLSQIMI